MRSRIVVATLFAIAAGAGIVAFLSRGGGGPPEADIAPVEEPAPPAPADSVAAPPGQAPAPAAKNAAEDATAIAGRVRNAAGGPVWRAQVRCLIGSEEVKATRTNRAGEFVLSGLDGRIVYSVEASAAGHMAERIDDVPVPLRGLDFTLRRGARLKGQVLTADVGMPLRGFTLTLTGAEERSVEFEEADGGGFTVEGLKGGVYFAFVSAPGYKPSERKKLTIREGDTVTESFLVPPEE